MTTQPLTREPLRSATRTRSAQRATLPEASRFELRRARVDDAEAIADIAALVNISSYAQFDRGFLLFSYTAEEYAGWIERGYHSYLFSLDGEAIGFATAVRRDIALEDMYAGGSHPSLYAAAERSAQELGLNDYLVVHQIAITPTQQNRGYGEIFVSRLSRAEPGPSFSIMLESPLRNPRIRYWATRGVRKIDELREKPTTEFLSMEPGENPVEELIWGLYLLDEGSWSPRRVDPRSI